MWHKPCVAVTFLLLAVGIQGRLCWTQKDTHWGLNPKGNASSGTGCSPRLGRGQYCHINAIGPGAEECCTAQYFLLCWSVWAFELCPPCLVRNPLLWAWPACGIKAFGQHQRELITRGLPLLARWKPPTYNCVLFFKKWVILAELSLLTSLGAFEGIRVLGPASGIGTLSLQTSICCRREAKNAPKLGSGGNT